MYNNLSAHAHKSIQFPNIYALLFLTCSHKVDQKSLPHKNLSAQHFDHFIAQNFINAMNWKYNINIHTNKRGDICHNNLLIYAKNKEKQRKKKQSNHTEIKALQTNSLVHHRLKHRTISP